MILLEKVDIEGLDRLFKDVSDGQWKGISYRHDNFTKIVNKISKLEIGRFHKYEDALFVCELRNEFSKLTKNYKRILTELKFLESFKINEQATRDLWEKLHGKRFPTILT